jgi:GNAT superfamily N-acetyltransferase
MVMKHSGDYGTAAYASYRPEGREDEHTTVGEAHFHSSGELDNIGITPAHQRKGVGSMIWQAATALHQAGQTAEPRHSSERTDAGDAWAHKVGGPRPADRKRVFRN